MNPSLLLQVERFFTHFETYFFSRKKKIFLIDNVEMEASVKTNFIHNTLHRNLKNRGHLEHQSKCGHPASQ